MSALVISGSDLIRQLVKQFPYAWNVTLFNNVYCVASREWVDGPFAAYFFDYLAARDDLKYRSRGNQCEHFALRALLEAVDLFSKTDDSEIPAEAESIAIAAASYTRADGAGRHEVNLWYLDGKWVPWEPQQRRFFTFTEAECLSVTQAILS
jgi:hypothetical protein